MQLLFVSRSISERDPLFHRIFTACSSQKFQEEKLFSICEERDNLHPEFRIEKKMNRSGSLGIFVNCFFWKSIFATRKSKRNFSQSLVISPSPSTLYPDVLLVNFSHYEYVSKIWKSKDLTFREFFKLLLNLNRVVYEFLILKVGKPQLVLCNSPGLTNEFKIRASNETKVEYLPNVVRLNRFCQETRKTHRHSSRELYGFQESEVIFAFASFGHFLRKGFHHAFRSLRRAREILREVGCEKRLRFLVIGGEVESINRLCAWAAQLDVDFESWLTFTGAITEPEVSLSAADAFIFPSYFDSSPNVVIEAAALGLDLFLTNFHGSELFLSEHKNAWEISHDVEDSAQILATYISDRTDKEGFEEKELLDQFHTPDTWAEALYNHFKEVEKIKFN